MFPNRLKLGHKRKESTAGLKPTKLTFACYDKTDMQNLENHGEAEPIETTQIIKSSPNIQICSPRLFTSQNNSITPFNQVSNLPLSQRDYPKAEQVKNESRNDTELSECRVKLEQSKRKIEQYRQAINTLTTQNDSLRNNKKILEAELNNCSKDYYQRELTRLRNQCEQYQIENMTNQHKIDTIAQEKSQLDAANKKKADEIKNYIKQLERQKLTIVELRNQLNEKEKTFKFALEESQKSNQLLNKTIFDFTVKSTKLESELRQKNKSIESLSKQNEIISSRFKECDASNLATRKRYEELLAEKDNKICAVSNESNAVIKGLEQNIQKMKCEIKGIRDDQSSKSIQISKMSLDIKSEQENIDKSLKIARFQQQINELKLIIQSKDKTITSLESKLKQYYSPNQYGNLEKKCKEADDKRLTSAKYYQEKLYNLQKQNEKLKLEKLSTLSTANYSSGMTTQKMGSISFNQILRKNIEESTAIKQELKLKIEQNQEIKSQMIQVKLKEKKYINEIQILTKRIQSEQKNIKIELQVERQKFTNDLDSLKRKMHTLETRLQYKISENKQKDEFIKNTIIGRSKPSDVPFIVAELERIFLERERIQLIKQ